MTDRTKGNFERLGADLDMSPGLPPFGSYRDLMDKITVGSRGEGVLSEDAYNKLKESEEVIFADVGGVTLPILLPLEYSEGLGYEAQKCESILLRSGCLSAMVLAIPASVIDEPTVRESLVSAFRATKGPAGLFFSINSSEEGGKVEEVGALVSESGRSAKEVFLVDGRSLPGHQQAALSMYSFSIEPSDGPPNAGRITARELWALGNSEAYPEVSLAIGSELGSTELDELWSLYRQRFQWLGNDHPISMEDSRQEFEGILRTDNTLVSMVRDDHGVACFTYFLDSTDKLYWLNQKYLDEIDKVAGPDRSVLFFPGVVARATNGRYAAKAIAEIMHAVEAANKRLTVIFENTNLSEIYVPRITNGVLKQSKKLLTTYPQPIDRTTFHLFRIDK